MRPTSELRWRDIMATSHIPRLEALATHTKQTFGSFSTSHKISSSGQRDQRPSPIQFAVSERPGPAAREGRTPADPDSMFEKTNDSPRFPLTRRASVLFLLALTALIYIGNAAHPRFSTTPTHRTLSSLAKCFERGDWAVDVHERHPLPRKGAACIIGSWPRRTQSRGKTLSPRGSRWHSR